MKTTTLLKKFTIMLLIVIGAFSLKGQQPVQYLTFDGGSGPGSEMWSKKLEIPWVNKGVGDWMDANQTPQGTTPYTSTNVTAKGPVNFSVNALVTRWLSNKLNRGFFLKTTQGFALAFDGRTSVTTSKRPKLTIVTNTGTYNPPCISNTNWYTSSYAAQNTKSYFKVSSGGSAIVQFDLAGVTGIVQSATLTLNCDTLKYAGVINVYEANPPVVRDGGGGMPPVMGIAQSYTLDKNISQHPDVLFASDFSDMSKAHWTNINSITGTQVYDPATQSTYIRGVIDSGATGSCSILHTEVRGNSDGSTDTTENELYARYYVYLESDWGSTVDGNKMPGFDCRLGRWSTVGYWNAVTGNGGSPGSGLKVWNNSSKKWEYHGHSMRGHGGIKYNDGNPYDELYWIGSYMYNLDQGSAYGDGLKWNGTVLSKGKWYCIEQYCKMNSITGPYDTIGNGLAVKDGIYRAWVDGVLVWEKTDLRWTRHAELGIAGFWMNWYHGGTAPSPYDMHYRMNSLVVARKYIGPRVDAATGISNGEEMDNSVRLYPNPSGSAVDLNLKLEGRSAVSAWLTNIEGQTLKTIYKGEMTEGENKVTTDVSEFASGFYLVRIQLQDRAVTRKFLISK